MGEIAEMMLDGTLCSTCGSYVGRGDGFPRSCCEPPAAEPRDRRRTPKPGKIGRRLLRENPNGLTVSRLSQGERDAVKDLVRKGYLEERGGVFYPRARAEA